MKYTKYIVSCGLLLLMATDSHLLSRDTGDQCLAMVRRIYRKLTTVTDPADIFHAEYHIRTEATVEGTESRMCG